MRPVVIEDGGKQYQIEAPETLFEMIALTAPRRPLTFQVTYYEDGDVHLEVWHHDGETEQRWVLAGQGPSLVHAVQHTAGWELWSWPADATKRERIK